MRGTLRRRAATASRARLQPFWDGWVGNLTLFVSAAACFARAAIGGRRRAAAASLGLGMLSFAVGNVIYLGWTQFQADPPVPSPADLAYPCVVAAVVSLVRQDDGSLPRSVWLDGALGAAGAATALTAVLSPVLTGIEGDLGEVWSVPRSRSPTCSW